MENHSTFNLNNVLELENWLVVFAAMWKMFTFFWPIVVIAIVWFYIEAKKESKANLVRVKAAAKKRSKNV